MIVERKHIRACPKAISSTERERSNMTAKFLPMA